MAEELGECPNNTEDTVCLSYNCPYKHDRVWPIPPAIEEAMKREIDYEVFLVSRQDVPELLESYVDRMLKTQTKCPCGCGGQFVPPAEKASIETIQCSNCDEVVLKEKFGDHYCDEYQQKETGNA